jgi:hypothetical protein
METPGTCFLNHYGNCPFCLGVWRGGEAGDGSEENLECREGGVQQFDQ